MTRGDMNAGTPRLAMLSEPSPPPSILTRAPPAKIPDGFALLPRVVRVLAAIVFGLVIGTWLLVVLARPDWLAVDFLLYRDATLRWLEGGSFYQPYQLAGPYPVTFGAILYPPPALLLLVPGSLLPAVLWWLVPLAVTTAIVIWHRPSAWGWLALATLAVWPFTPMKILSGNPVMWMTMLVALGTIYRWPSALVLLFKPTLAPFALLGIRHRSWWLALGGAVLVAILFVPMWPDYLAVAANARDTAPMWLYSLPEFPIVAIPLVAARFSGRRHSTNIARKLDVAPP